MLVASSVVEFASVPASAVESDVDREAQRVAFPAGVFTTPPTVAIPRPDRHLSSWTVSSRQGARQPTAPSFQPEPSDRPNLRWCRLSDVRPVLLRRRTRCGGQGVQLLDLRVSRHRANNQMPRSPRKAWLSWRVVPAGIHPSPRTRFCAWRIQGRARPRVRSAPGRSAPFPANRCRGRALISETQVAAVAALPFRNDIR